MLVKHDYFIFTEAYMRRIVKPLEALLTSHKRIVLKDSAVSSYLLLLPMLALPHFPSGERHMLWSKGVTSRGAQI